MADKVRRWTDRKLLLMESKIDSIYREATEDLTEKWAEYMKRGEKRLKGLYDAYENASIADKAIALERYQKALESYTLKNQWYADMIDETTTRIAHVNQIALSYANGELPAIYAKNYAAVNADLVQLGLDKQYHVFSESAIKKMILTDKITTPYITHEKILNIPKDKRWNMKTINSQVLQGIIQGESIPQISSRIFPEIMDKTDMEGLTEKEKKSVITKNKKSAIRNARTMVTGVENGGRLDSYKSLSQKGLVMQKVWISTADKRTRDWHLSMDGQLRNLNENFEDGNGDELRYPGDPKAEPRTVYNCRCGMRTEIIGFRKADGHIDYLEMRHEPGLHQEQIEKEKQKRKK